MCFLRTALDESTDRHRQHVFVVAGYLARQEKVGWEDIENKWQQILTKAGMKYFSTSEYTSLTGEFARFRDAVKYPKPQGRLAATKIRDHLQNIMKNGRAAGFGLGFILKDYRAIRKSSRVRKVLHSDPYGEAYTMMMVIIAGEIEEQMPSRELVAFLCDEHDKAVNVKNIYDELKRMNPVCGKRMGSLTHMDNEESPALQAADLLAAQCKEMFVEQLTRPNDRTLRDTFKSRVGSEVSVRYMDKQTLMQLVDANLLKNGKPSIYSTQQLIMFKDLLLGKNGKTK